ncbi:MAG: hypothetical protein ABSD59_04375 [Terracidiphilus sp.]
MIALLLSWPSVSHEQQAPANQKNQERQNTSNPAPPSHVVIEPSPAIDQLKPLPTTSQPETQEKPLPRFLRPEWVNVYVTVFYVLISWLMLRKIKRQADLMEGAAKDARESSATATAIAKQAADAAKTSADVATGMSIPTLVVHQLGQGDVGSITSEAFFQFPKVKIAIKNYGQTPAFLKWWCLCFTCEELPEVPIYDGPAVGMILDKEVVQPNDVYILPGLGFPHRQEFSTEDVQAIVSREKIFRVYGYVCYGDIFGNPLRRLKFCETVLNIFGAEGAICDWVEGVAPPAYTGTEQFPTQKLTQQHS